MILRIHKPHFPLNDFVEHLVYYEGLETSHSLDRFLPDGNTEIIIDLTERPQFVYDNQTLRQIQTCRRVWVSGVRTGPITIPSGRGNTMLIIAFRKGKAFPFYRCPMQEITDRIVEAELVFGRVIADLREELLDATSPERMFPLVEEFLLSQAGDGIHESVSTRSIHYALRQIAHNPGKHCLHKLSDQIGYSQRHFIHLFREQVGVSPKQYLKLMRFQRAIDAIERDQTIRWSRIALESGFYDQAHFIHDFKHFSGFTPNEYVQRKSALLNYVPVG